MISPRLTVLMATMAVLGASAPAAFANNSYDPSDPSVTVNVDRNNEIDQSIEQSNEACTNTLVAIEDGKGDQYVDAYQKNKCYVEQSNYASQYADIDDFSYNEIYTEVFQDN
jgi:hypothetical protein